MQPGLQVSPRLNAASPTPQVAPNGVPGKTQRQNPPDPAAPFGAAPDVQVEPDAAFAAVGEIRDEIIGKAMVVTIPIFLINSRRDIPLNSSGISALPSIKFSFFSCSSVSQTKPSSIEVLSFLLSSLLISVSDLFPSQAFQTKAEV